MATLEGFVAFTEARAQDVESQGRLMPTVFGPPKKWIPFADTLDCAVDKAMTSSTGNPHIALSPTKWCVLHVALTAEECVHAFKDGRIQKSTYGPAGVVQPGWRHYGELQLGLGHAFEWITITVAPIGVLLWADKALTTHYKRHADSCCCGCSAAHVITWTASKEHRHEKLCADCCLRYFQERASQDDADEMVHASCEDDAMGHGQGSPPEVSI